MRELRIDGWQAAIDNEGVITAALDLPGKINIMDDRYIAAMERLLGRLEKERDYAGVIFTSAKPVFLAGGDLKRMSQAQRGQEQEYFDYFQNLKSYLRRIEKLNRPMVAAINGTALGGGYEMCLACHHRVALRDPRLRIGLPEVEFGILPGAGGVVRLTRLLGFEKALPFLIEGRTTDVMAALEAGLVDDLADDHDELLRKARKWIKGHPQARQPWDERDNATPVHIQSKSVRQAMACAPAKLFKLQGRPSVAAQRTMALSAETLAMDFDAALRYETRVLLELLMTDHAQEQMRAFLNRGGARAASKEVA